MAEVTLDGVSKRFRGREVIPELSLTVRNGELFILVGPSGCGKSTLMHLIAGLEAPSAGRILFDDDDVTSLSPRDRDVALVFQSYALYPHMTVADNLAFPLRVVRRAGGATPKLIAAEVGRIAELLGISGVLDRRPRELSGGQRQRVALGRALIRQPRVFLLDEPLSNLDAQLRAVMRTELRRLHDQLGITMIYVTHDQTEAMTLADRLAVLDRGRLQQVGKPRDLYERPANRFVAQFVGSPSMNMLDATIKDGRAETRVFDLPICLTSLRSHEGQPIVLGIRPENLLVSGGASAPDLAGGAERVGSGIVRLVELSGGQTWVTVEAGRHPDGGLLVGAGIRSAHYSPGDRVDLWLPEVDAACHLFEPATGRRLGEE